MTVKSQYLGKKSEYPINLYFERQNIQLWNVPTISYNVCFFFGGVVVVVCLFVVVVVAVVVCNSPVFSAGQSMQEKIFNGCIKTETLHC
jgi:hypothetical protein